MRIVVILVLAAAAHAQFDVSISPEKPLVGEVVSYRIVSKKGRAKFTVLPRVDGFGWRRAVPSYSRTDEGNETTYTLQAERPGTITIESRIELEGKEASHSLSFEVASNGVRKEDVFLRVKTGNRKHVYRGQAVPIQVQLWINEKLNVSDAAFDQGLLPDLRLSEVDYRRFHHHQRNHRFRISGRKAQYKDQAYRCVIFDLVVFPRKGNLFYGRVRHQLPVVISGDDDDDILKAWQSSPKRLVWVPVQTTIPDTKIHDLPPPPEGALVPGLIGDFDIDMKLDWDQRHVGQDVTLSLTAKGSGNLEHIRGVPLELPGFDVYKPQTTVQDRQARIEWILAGKSVTSKLPQFRVATFSPRQREWITSSFNLDLKLIGTSKETVTKAVPYAPPLHRATHVQIANVSPWQHSKVILGLLFLGPCVLLGTVLFKHVIPSRQERERRRALKAVAHAIRSCSEDELPGVANTHLLDWLRVEHGLAVGASATEVIEKLNDAELGEMLSELAIANYRPGSRQFDRNRLLRCIARLSVLVGLLAISTHGDERLMLARVAYDAGDYEGAVKYNQDAIREGADVQQLVNLGHAYFCQGRLNRALLAYERARLLRPCDSLIRESIARCRIRLEGNARVATWKRYRDLLRPDTWAVVAAIAWSAIFLLLSTWPVRRQRFARVLVAIAVLGFIAGAGSAWTQHQGAWHPQRALVLGNSSLYRLPDVLGTSGDVLRQGKEVRVLELRDGWYRVRTSNREGWIKADFLGYTNRPANGFSEL